MPVTRRAHAITASRRHLGCCPSLLRSAIRAPSWRGGGRHGTAHGSPGHHVGGLSARHAAARSAPTPPSVTPCFSQPR